MADTVIDRIVDECPPFSEWTGGTVATDPTTTGTEVPNKEFLDMGTVDVSGGDANSTAQALTVEFRDDFDDSVYVDTATGTECRLWCANKPLDTTNKIFAEFANGATLPAVSLTAALTSGVEIPGDPFAALEGGATIYDATNNRVGNILLQMQSLQTGNSDFDQSKKIHGAPYIVVEMPRLDATTSAIDPSDFTNDTEAGHLFTYTDIQLYIADANGNLALIGGGKNINSIKEDTIEIESTEEHVKWEKAKPMTTYQTARASLVSGINFKLDQCNIALESLSHQTTASVDTNRGTVKYTVNAKSSRTKENVYYLRYRTHGGFLVTVKCPRGILTMTGAYSPGATEFAGGTFRIEALASGVNRDTLDINYSLVPYEAVFLPITYAITT